MNWFKKLFHKCDFSNQPVILIQGYEFVKCKHCNTYDPVGLDEETKRCQERIEKLKANRKLNL
jgi:hypothetical protein